MKIFTREMLTQMPMEKLVLELGKLAFSGFVITARENSRDKLGYEVTMKTWDEEEKGATNVNCYNNNSLKPALISAIIRAQELNPTRDNGL